MIVCQERAAMHLNGRYPRLRGQGRITELAHRTGLGKVTAFNILKRLVDERQERHSAEVRREAGTS